MIGLQSCIIVLDEREHAIISTVINYLFSDFSFVFHFGCRAWNVHLISVTEILGIMSQSPLGLSLLWPLPSFFQTLNSAMPKEHYLTHSVCVQYVHIRDHCAHIGRRSRVNDIRITVSSFFYPLPFTAMDIRKAKGEWAYYTHKKI